MKTTKNLADVFAVVLGPVAACYAEETGKALDVRGLVRAAGQVAARWFRGIADKLDTQVKTEAVAEAIERQRVEQPAAVPAGWDVVDTSVPVEEPAPTPRGWASLGDVRLPSEPAPAAEVKPAARKPRNPAAAKKATTKKPSKATGKRKAAPKVKPAATSHAARVRAERTPKSKSATK